MQYLHTKTDHLSGRTFCVGELRRKFILKDNSSVARVYIQTNYQTNYLFVAQVRPGGSSLSINRANNTYCKYLIAIYSINYRDFCSTPNAPNFFVSTYKFIYIYLQWNILYIPKILQFMLIQSINCWFIIQTLIFFEICCVGVMYTGE